MKQNENGITLVSLVVAIIVLIIISGVTVYQLVSDNGIVDKSLNETQYHEEAVKNEQRKINEVTQSQMEDWGF